MVGWVCRVDSNILQPQLDNDEKYLRSGGYNLIYTIGAIVCQSSIHGRNMYETTRSQGVWYGKKASKPSSLKNP